MLSCYAPVTFQTPALHGVPNNSVILANEFAYGDCARFKLWHSLFRRSECIPVLLAYFFAGLSVEAAAYTVYGFAYLFPSIRSLPNLNHAARLSR